MIITFDFDTTLSLSRPTPEGGWEDRGPNLPLLLELRRHLAAGERVFIVTRREETGEQDASRSISIQEFLTKHDLKPEGVIFTNGEYKASTLIKVGSTLHYDDDPDEAMGLPPEIEFRLVNDGLAPRPGTWQP